MRIKLPLEEKKRRQRLQYKAWRARKIKDGDCPRCTKPLNAESLADGRKICRECRAHDNASYRARYARSATAVIEKMRQDNIDSAAKAG